MDCPLVRVRGPRRLPSILETVDNRNTLPGHTVLGSVVKLTCQTCNSLNSVIPAKERHPVFDTGPESRISLQCRTIREPQPPGFWHRGHDEMIQRHPLVTLTACHDRRPTLYPVTVCLVRPHPSVSLGLPGRRRQREIADLAARQRAVAPLDAHRPRRCRIVRVVDCGIIDQA